MDLPQIPRTGPSEPDSYVNHMKFIADGSVTNVQCSPNLPQPHSISFNLIQPHPTSHNPTQPNLHLGGVWFLLGQGLVYAS